MNYSKFLPRQMADNLRRLKAFAYGLSNRVKMFAKSRRAASGKGTIVLLSLGGMRGSPILSRAVSELGYDLHVLSPAFPSYEAGFARGWTRIGLENYGTSISDAIKKISPQAVMVEQRNILLPLMAQAQREFGLPISGSISHLTSNSKIEFRKAVDEANLPNLAWVKLDDYNASKFKFPFMLKPETGTGSRGVALIKNTDELDQAKANIADMVNDPTVGGQIILEAYIKGRQFDVEGICHKGKCYPLSLTEERYDIVGNSFPSSWYLFSPPVGAIMRQALFRRTAELVQALGVCNGAFHCEMRVGEDNEIYPIDYSNRMGYPKLVSYCSGYSFPRQYVQSLVGDNFTPPNPQENTVFQRFVREREELSRFKRLVHENPGSVLELKMLGSVVAGVKILARIAIVSKTYVEMQELLIRYGLMPDEWETYYREPQ